LSNCHLSFTAKTTSTDLRLLVRLDGTTVFDQTLTLLGIPISYTFDDAESQDHVLEIEMQGKQTHHTQVDSVGQITQDQVIEILDVSLDGLELGQVFFDHAKYHHDFNGTGSDHVEKFFGTMGCNGVVQFKFASPVYLWLLENM